MTTVPPSSCAFERAAGRPCPVCRSIQAGTTVLQNTPAMDAGHADHVTLARAVDRAHARQLYAERGFHLFDEEIGELTRAQRAELDAWAAGTGPLPAAFMARAHVASEGPLVGCRRCTLALDDSPSLYAPGTYVGLDCEGDGAAGEPR